MLKIGLYGEKKNIRATVEAKTEKYSTVDTGCGKSDKVENWIEKDKFFLVAGRRTSNNY
jgi:hypothetical protein